MKVASINIRAIRSPDRVRHLLQVCLNNSFDVVGLQEVAFTESSILEQHYYLLSNVGPRRLGTAVLVRRGLNYKRELLDPEGRLISIDVGPVTVINIYAPSGTRTKEERNEFLRKTIPAYASTSKLPVILMGDFNCVETSADRSNNNRPTNPAKRTCLALTEMVAGLELVDIWLKLKPGDHGHTFFHPRGSSRIDRVYCSRDWMTNILLVKIDPITFSDHWCLSFSISDNATYLQRTKQFGLWKLNTAILREEAYINKINSYIDRISNHPLRQSSVSNWWERVFKPGIKQESIRYCKQRAKLLSDTKWFYQQCIRDLVEAQTFDWIAYQNLKASSREWEESILKGFGVRSRDDPDLNDQDASVFHVKKARQNGQACKIDALISSSGVQITDRDEINNELINYYKSIFKERPPPNVLKGGEFLSMVSDLFPTNTNFLTEPFTRLDIKIQLMKTKKNKAPGNDGIPYEFYLAFWDRIAPHFLDMFNHVLERDSLSQSQGRALIRLIPKSKGVCGASGYRPISLLNTDYKLMAAVLANRLRKTLEVVIQPHQKGGVPGRLLFDNLCLYRDVIQYVDERAGDEQHCLHTASGHYGPKAGIIGVDLTKAYDLVNRDILWKIMEVMGYPLKFVSWIKTMYSIADMTLLNGNIVAGTIHDVQSIRQGCPLSMHLFVIYIEPLLVRLSNSIEGIQFFGNSIRVRAMVDDVVIFASRDDDVIKASEILDLFCDWTKAMMNREKTKIMGVGAWKNRQAWPVIWLRSSPTLKLLGIPFSPNIMETVDRVWDSAFGHMLGLMRENASRRLTLYQRVNFSKARILSRAIYIASVLPCPSSVSLKILNALVKFVFLGKIEKPARCVSFRPSQKGGLSLTNPELFFKALFLKNIYNSLLGPDTCENSLLRFWMGFPLRQHFGFYRGNSSPSAVFERPVYLQEPVRQILQLLEAKLITATRRLAHRAIYQHWLEPLLGSGKYETLYPNLDWNSIWRQANTLPASFKETMFLFNHRLLPTGARCHRLGISTTPNCNFCQTEPETDEHLMLLCPARQAVAMWLERTLRLHGCTTLPVEFIRGHLGPAQDTHRLFALVAAYIHINWRERRSRRVPSEEEITRVWNHVTKP